MPIRERDVVDALPPHGFLREYVEYASRCTDSNLIYHVGGALSCISQTCPSMLKISMGGRIYPNIFVMLVGPSTVSRKTAAVDMAKFLIEDAGITHIGEQPGSEEGLLESVRRENRQIITYGEFGNFLSSTDNNYLTRLKTAFNSLYDCAYSGRALAKSQRGIVREPRVSILAGCAPGYLERHTEMVDWTDGFMARWLTFYGNRERTYDIPGEEPGLRKGLLARLKDMNSTEVCGDFQGLDEAALRRWREWHSSKTNFKLVREAEAAIARGPGFAMKIALLLAWDYGQARSGRPWQITLAELEPAIRFAEMHIRSVMYIGENLASGKDMLDRRAALALLKDAKMCTLGEICVGAKILKQRAIHIMETLKTEGAVEEVFSQGGSVYCYRGGSDVVIEDAGFRIVGAELDDSDNDPNA